ncbi:predicted protein [Lichtheimia corymbifera JMRC:FSU:9682]|uniref:Uncharacterized protein n=1 Tax=Lichtheimia corymbifera JMRC:FSU:9682 TaxID=1263082 RepID=A0A068S291_9FUNG|nr:predicted protein [Lichtheimia corymbifera JMRC:FSU:9682]
MIIHITLRFLTTSKSLPFIVFVVIVTFGAFIKLPLEMHMQSWISWHGPTICRNLPDMELSFPDDVLDKLLSKCHNAWKMDKVFPTEVMLSLIQLSWSLSALSMNRIDVISAIMTTAKEASDSLDQKVILSFGSLMQTLPLEAIMEPTNESRKLRLGSNLGYNHTRAECR